MPEDVKPEDKPVIPADAINQNGQQSAEELAAQAAAEAAAAKAKEDAAADTAKAEADAKAKADADAADKAKADKKEKPLDLTVWESTGNEVGDAVLTKLQNSGVTPDEAKALLYDAVVAKDLTKIDKAALTEKVGEASATIIMDGIKSFLASVEASNAETMKSVHDVVGGSADNWAAVRTWAKENLTEEQRLEYADMINIGPKAAALAAKAMYEDYIAAGNTEFTSTTAVTPNVNAQGTAVTPLTAAQYFDAVEKSNKAGTYAADKDRLLQARLAGKKQGI